MFLSQLFSLNIECWVPDKVRGILDAAKFMPSFQANLFTEIYFYWPPPKKNRQTSAHSKFCSLAISHCILCNATVHYMFCSFTLFNLIFIIIIIIIKWVLFSIFCDLRLVVGRFEKKRLQTVFNPHRSTQGVLDSGAAFGWTLDR